MPPSPTPLGAATAIAKRLGSAGKKTIPGGSGKHYNLVKGEFLGTLVLVVVYPLAIRKYDKTNWVKRVIAVWLSYVLLLLIAKSGPKAGKFAAGIGGLIVLASLMDRNSAAGEIKTVGALATVAKALQPGGKADHSGEEPLFQGLEWPTGHVEKHFSRRLPDGTWKQL